MDPKYRRLTIDDRIRIFSLRARGLNFDQISTKTGRHKSTISRELARYPHTYFPTKAQEQADFRQRMKRRWNRKLDQYPLLLNEVLIRLRKRWSPEQISRTLALDFPKDSRMRVSHESIYTYIYVLPRGELRAELVSYLRQKKKSRYSRLKRGARAEKRGHIPEMISIEERPRHVLKRSLPGDWEGDLVMGKDHKSALGTLVERKTRAVILVPLKEKTASSVRRAFQRAVKTLPQQMRRSLTYDQGTEMTEHKLFEKKTKMKVYFCHPASPWERGTCENTNGLIRDYFPKKTDFSKVSKARIAKVQDELNQRPRKTLGYKNPQEVFKQEILNSLR